MTGDQPGAQCWQRRGVRRWAHVRCADIQQKLGITNEAADKIIQGMQNGRMLGGLQGASASKNMTLEKLVEMAKSGVDVASFTSEDKRAYLLSVEVHSSTCRPPAPFLLPPS